MARSLPPSTGAGGASSAQFSTYQNIGKTNNKGIELALNTVNIQTKDFKWNSTVTFAANQEKIVSLITNTDIIQGQNAEISSLLIGRPINSFYSYKLAGIWQLGEEEEMAKYKLNGTANVFKPGSLKVDQEKLFYVFGVLQLVYVQQDLVTEMLKIFKLREPKKDELKNKNRYIRNELVGHPISREKSKKFKSSVLIGNFTEESLTYYKYTVNNSKSEKVLVSIPDVIRIHAKFLNYYFDKILQRIEEINKQ